jgi:hypothetical protein
MMNRARAFGIDIESSFPIPCLPESSRNGTGRTSVQLASTKAVDRDWRAAEAESIIDRRLPTGRRLMTVDYHPELGYRIWASRFGRHLVASDGLNVLSALPAVPAWRWQRLLFAQVLPLAAALRGLDPFHASAVVVGDKAFAFVAASGSGKTSLAAHLVANGAGFMTDDVLSLELDGDRVLAHPGPAMASIAPEELRAMSAEGRGELGNCIGKESGKKHFNPPVVDRPYPLEAFYFLVRNGDSPRISIERVQSPDPRLLLASSFITYVRTPDHLLTHLDTCAHLARSGAIFEVRIPAGVDARTGAAFVREHLEGAT